MQTLKPGTRSRDVGTLLQELVERGIHVPAEPRAGDLYSPALVEAVRRFQAESGLFVDGVVGPRTWAALLSAAPNRQTLSAIRTEGLPLLVARTLQIADAYCRKPVVEVPPRSNRGPDVDRFLLGWRKDGAYLLDYDGPGKGAPWCARWAKFCVDEAAAELGLPSPLSGWGDLASSAKWLTRGRAAGRLTTTAAAGLVGCILASDRSHVVFVAAVGGDGLIETREGNSGDRCAARKRRPEEFAGFVRFAP